MPNEAINQFVPPFKDRNRERAHAIDMVFSEQAFDEHRVLVFYGSGGHGKTSLSHEVRKELKGMIESKDGRISKPLLIANLDFDSNSKIGASSPRQLHEALKSIRVQLGRQIPKSFFSMPRANFPAFDIAFREFHSMVSPNLSFETSHPDMAGDNTYLKGLINAADVWLMGFMGYLWEVFGKRKSQELWDAYHGGKLVDRQWLQSLSIPQLRETLIDCFAADIKTLMWDKKYVSNQLEFDGKCRVVVFIDTYEALWQDATDMKGIAAKRIDSWVRRLVQLTPGVVYIITGRDALQWQSKEIEGGLDQKRLEGLPWDDGDAALREVGIGDVAIRETILSSAHINTGQEGRRILPYMLQLDAYTYGEKLKRYRESGGPKPNAAMFGGENQDVLARFLEHLNQDERDALNYLCVPRAFGEELFDLLKLSYFSERPILYSELRERSLYRTSNGGQSLTIHALLREHMAAHVAEKNPKLLSEIKGFLHRYYDHELLLAEKQRRYFDMVYLFEEAVYHRDDKCSPKYYTWLVQKVISLNYHMEGAAALPALHAAYDETDKIFKRSGGDQDSLVRHISLAQSLAQTLYNEEQYAEAAEIFQSKIDEIERFIGENAELEQSSSSPSTDYIETQSNYYGHLKLIIDGGIHEEANLETLRLFKQVMNINPDFGSPGTRLRSQLAYLQLGYARTLSAIGGSENYTRAMEIFDSALQIAKVSMSESDSLVFRTSLASFLDSRGRHVEAEPQFHLAMNAYMMLGQSRAVAVMASNLSKCLRSQGRAEEAVRYARIMYVWFLDHDIRGGMDRAVASHVLGVALTDSDQFDESEQCLLEAQRYYDKHLEIQHNYSSKVHQEFASLNLRRGDLDGATRHLATARAKVSVHTNKRAELLAVCDQIEGDILLRAGDYRAAIGCFKKALVSIEQINGVDRISTIRILASLVEACEGVGDPDAAGRYRSHLQAAVLSSDMRLQLEGFERTEVFGDHRDRLLLSLRDSTSVPSNCDCYTIHRIETNCFRSMSLYQITIKAQYGDIVKYVFDCGMPITWTNEVFGALISLGVIDYNPAAAIQLAQIFASGIRTSDDQFWMIVDKDKVPTQPGYEPDGRHMELRRKLDTIVPPKLVDTEFVRDLLQSRLDALNESMSSDFSLAQIQDEDFDLPGQNDEKHALYEEIREVIRVIDRDADRVYIDAYMVYSTGLYRVLLSLKTGALFEMLLDEEIISDPTIGFRKTIKASEDK